MLGEGEVLVLCPPSAEGVLGAVGLTYLARAGHDRVRLAAAGSGQPRLGEQVMEVEGSASLAGLAARVFAGLERSVARGCSRARRGVCGGCEGACANRVLYACASDDPAMPQATLEYVRLCFDVGPGVAHMIAHPVVSRLESIARRVANECERTRQFVRFSQREDGSFFASFSPAADTIPLVAPYFAARMGGERFCLLDPVHRVACLHVPGAPCQVARLDAHLVGAWAAQDVPSDDELGIRELWRTFYQRVSLDGRSPQERGYDLRAKWVPKRLWSGLPELA